ncbi:MAG: division/cell wall cluster transcriptional repressor MraZ [Planctomycetes bacterium]|nr:division/cell wall cluster transcriptional repressor MraZ [Planctomycetota bacterium]
MYIRRFTGSAVAISLDPQFRFVMPDKLKAAVGIQNDVCLVGVPRMIEIWAKDRYERWEKESSELEIPEPAAAPARSGGEGGSSSSG